MKTLIRVVATAGMLVAAGAVAHAACVNKAGRGTGGNDESAKFQAWEAVLQGTDWGIMGILDGVEPEGRCGTGLQGEQRQGTLHGRRLARQGVHGASENSATEGHACLRQYPAQGTPWCGSG